MQRKRVKLPNKLRKPSSLEKLLNSAVDKKIRTDDFRKSFSSNFNYYDLPVMDGSLILDKKKVIKLKLFISVTEDKKGYSNASAVLYIKFQDGTSQASTVKKDKIDRVAAALEKNGASQNITYVRMSRDRIRWHEKSMISIYEAVGEKKGDEYKVYDKLHKKIIDEISNIMLGGDKIEEAIIIDGGCGDGRFLKRMEKEMVSLRRPIHLIGFDYNQSNIEDCLRDYTGQCAFIQGNLLEIDKILSNYKLTNSLSTDIPVILVLSGSLTRSVLSSGFEALVVLKNAYLSRIDYLIGGGLREPLINDSIVKHVGYKGVGHFSSDDNFFSYRRLTEKKILENKISKISRRNFLDLSLFPNPEEMLKKLEGHLVKNMTIDLSFCDLDDSLIELLKSIIEKYHVNFIFWHQNQQMRNLFELKIATLSVAATRMIEKKSDAYLMASRSFFARVEERGGSEKILNMLSKSELPSSAERDEEYARSKRKNIYRQIVRAGRHVEILRGAIECEFIFNELGLKNSVEDVEKMISDKISKYENQAINSSNGGIEVKKGYRFHVYTDNKIRNWIKSLEEKVLKGDFSQLSLLLYIYRCGILRVAENEKNDDYIERYFIGLNAKEELKLYHRLAELDTQRFKPEDMKEISKLVVKLRIKDKPAIAVEIKKEFEEIWNEKSQFSP